MCDLVQWNIIDAKPPDKIFNVAHVFLVGLRGKGRLEQPLAIMYLTNLANLLKGSDTLMHDRNLPWSIQNLLNGNWGGVASVDDALVVSNRRKYSAIVKHTPIFLNQTE